MINIKRFIDKVSIAESKNSRDLILPIAEARALRDEVSKLLAELHQEIPKKGTTEKTPDIEIQIVGGRF